MKPTEEDKQKARTPSDLIAFKWAESLSMGEQSVLLTSNLKRLQSQIDAALTETRAETWKECRSVVWMRLYSATNGNEGWLTDKRVQELIADIYDFMPYEAAAGDEK
jgi:hypothetical protein